MNAKILVIEYEPRYVDRVRKALTEVGHVLEVAGDLEAAVDRCAHFEPQLVIITSVLPRLKIEDAITQLRGRAGLRTTPVLILMSGYRGTDSKADASRYGAQDILERPFSGEVLVQRVEHLLRGAVSPVATQAIPQDMLEALRRSAGLSGDTPSVTSSELFGDILSDVESDDADGGAAGDVVKPPAAAATSAPKATPTSGVDRALADVLGAGRATTPIRRAAPPSETDVDAILSQTLAGLDIQPVRRREPKPPPTPPAGPASSGAPPPAKVAPPPAPEAKEPALVGPPASSGTAFGQYLLQEHIATGGMAEVYKARMMGMEGFQKTVAIKRILSHLTDNDEFVTMFIDEAKLAAQLNHNNIIHIYDLGKIDRSHYIAMEYIEGRDLRSILQQTRDRGLVMPVALSLYITTLLASALDYAHKKRDFENRDLGLVHRDVSPQNVLISNEGSIKLCDFGIAKAASKASHTRAGALKGKLQYMSPEQAWGKDIDQRSDIFSLGLVLYEMLTSEKVFTGDSELSILEQVRNPRVDPPSERNPQVTTEIDRIVAKALDSDREKRYQAARDLQRDLEKVMRKAGWSLDTAAVATFLHELSSGAEISQLASSVESAGAGGEGPPAKPKVGPKPDAGPPEPPAAAVQPRPTVKTAPKTAPPAKAEVKMAPPPEPIPIEPPAARQARSKGGLWLVIGGVLVIAIVAGLLWMRGSGSDEGPPPVVAHLPAVDDEAEGTGPEPVEGPDDFMTRAAEIAAAEVARQEEELRRRLEAEFPTATPVPPTETPTATPTPEPDATATPTLPPPTATRVPPTATPVPPTATPSVVEGQIVTLGPGVVAPAVISQEEPRYPPMARNMRASGSVEAEALVGTDGRVEQVRILSVSPPSVGFEKATEEAVMQWRYKPATKHGVKVRMWVKIRVPFNYR